VRLELRSGGQSEQMAGRLWDISALGACVAVPGFQRLVVPAPIRLLLLEPMTMDRHTLEAELRWTSALSHTTFLGMVFSAGPLPRNSFLSTYMRGSWTDSVPRSNFSL
jgi:hypothetical protein